MISGVATGVRIDGWLGRYQASRTPTATLTGLSYGAACRKPSVQCLSIPPGQPRYLAVERRRPEPDLRRTSLMKLYDVYCPRTRFAARSVPP
jgi:hypothetical protein